MQLNSKTVLMSGVFDLINSGHIFAFNIAKSFGDRLIINVVPDNRVKEKKGNGRPILSEREREFIVRSIKGVDDVVCIEYKPNQTREEYEISVVDAVVPDVFIRNGYSETLDNFCKSKNIKFVVLPEVHGIDRLHTTDIIKLINKLN